MADTLLVVGIVVILCLLGFLASGCKNMPPVELCFYYNEQKACIKVGGDVKFDPKLTAEEVKKIRESEEFRAWLKEVRGK